MTTSQLYLKYKEDNDLDLYHFFSFEELLEIGDPIDVEGIDMILESDDVYIRHDNDNYVLLS